jgi:hypothetical protein
MVKMNQKILENSDFLDKKLKFNESSIKLNDFENKKYNIVYKFENIGNVSNEFKIENIKSQFIKIHPMEGN